MAKKYKIDSDKRDISDGYHTFGELYEHRYALFGALCAKMGNAWKSKLHDDGTMFENSFIAGVNLSSGSVTYHLPIEMYDSFPARELERAPPWDGHDSGDVLKKLFDSWK